MGKIKDFNSFNLNESKSGYSAVVLDKQSIRDILKKVKNPENWVQHAHHMTICMGQLPPDQKDLLGKRIKLKVVGIKKTDLVLALKIQSPIKVQSGNPHVTVYVNIEKGGIPKLSKSIEDWEPFTNFYINGTVEELSEI